MRRPERIGYRGTSLVEILVVLVVLVIGIFSLVRLFPPGFGFILYGKNVTQGSTLARSELERLRTAAAHLPDGIGPINPNDGTVDTLLDPIRELDPFVRAQGLPPEDRFSDVNKFRRVWGEVTKIPAPTSESPYLPVQDPSTGQREPVSLYTLAFSPIYDFQARQGSPSIGIVVYAGTPLERVALDGPPSDAELRQLGDDRYGIDYANAVLYFAPSTYARQYKMEFSFTTAVGGNSFVRENSVPDFVISLPAGVNRFDLRTALPNGARLEPDQEQLFRAFEQIPAGQPFSGVQPYEFKVLNTLIGIIGFNPLGAAGRGGYTPGGRPLTAKIDYDVDDWHIVREDRVVPQLAPFTVELTLNGLKRIGDIEENQQQYYGLLRDYPDRPTPTENIDLAVIDLDTGLTIDSRTMQTEPLPGADVNDLNGQIDYNRGRIEFKPVVRWTLPGGNFAPEQSIAGRRIRIYYRTEQDWGVQITKAYSRYARDLEPNLLGNGQYYQGPDEKNRPTLLFFPPIDHDRSVLVDYTWVQQISPTEKRVVTESGELHQISDPKAAVSTVTSSAPIPLGGAAWGIRLNLADRLDRGEVAVAPGEPIVIQSVRGVSLQARAIWREGTRWRHLDHTTLLSR
jgi:hypothetical protein